MAQSLGSRALLVGGATPSRANHAAELLRASGVDPVRFAVVGEPKLETVQQGTAIAKENACDMVVAVGGGSAIDAAKAISAMLNNPGELLDYVEVIGRGRALQNAAAPCIAVPTTAGTGAEVTRNAVLGSPEHGVKVSLRSPLMLPRAAIIDPELTYHLPVTTTISTGLDALTQLIEPYVSPRANPMTDAVCVEGLQRAARSLRKVVENGNDAAAREDMAIASLFGGIALANAGLGAVHGFAAPIGGMFPAPHGAVCAALLPHVMKANLLALRSRAPQHSSMARYEHLGRLLTGKPAATADEGVEWVRRLVSEFRVVPLREYGIAHDQIDDLCEKAARASSMKANPVELNTQELREVLEAAL